MNRRWKSFIKIGLILLAAPLFASASISPYQVIISDSGPSAESSIQFDFTTSFDIPASSTINFDFVSDFTLPDPDFEAGQNITVLIDGVAQDLDPLPDNNSFGVVATTTGYQLTSPTDTIIAAPAVFDVLLGTEKLFTNPADSGVYAVSTGIDEADGTMIEHAGSWIAIVESVAVSADDTTEPSSTTSSGGGSSRRGSGSNSQDTSDSPETTDTETDTSTTTPTTTDIVSDGVVDTLDVDVMSLLWGTTDISTVDLNGDGILDVQDLGALMHTMTSGETTSSQRFPIGPPLSEEPAVLSLEKVTELKSAFLDSGTSTPLTLQSVVGETVTLVVKLTTGPALIGAIDTIVNYDPSLLKLTNIYTDESIISAWILKPIAASGAVHFIGGIPGGFLGSGGPLVVMDFQAIKSGASSITFASNSSVAHADSTGSLAALSMNSALMETDAAASIGQTRDSAPTSAYTKPTITSSSHPDEQTWYANPTVDLSWTGTTPVSYLFDHSTDSLPDTITETEEQTLQIKDVADGEWIFHLRPLCVACTADLTASHRVKIDTTSPEPFVIKKSHLTLLGEEVPFLSFVTTDAMSGVVEYQITIANQSTVLTTGPYIIPPLSPGWYLAEVIALDAAGNQQTASTRVIIEGETSPKPKLRDELTTSVLIVLCLLVLSVLQRQIKHRRRRK